MKEEAGRKRVQCDENCGAFDEPDPGFAKELLEAYRHWRFHDCLGGCSHER